MHSIFSLTKPHLRWRALAALALAAALAAACAPASISPTPSPQPSPQPTAVAANPSDGKDLVVSAAQTALAEALQVDVGVIQPLETESVQWPDSCLGVPQANVMCAMHVVDGYRVTLSVNGFSYEAHANADGSQVALLPGPLPTPTGLALTRQNAEGCQAFVFRPEEDAAYGICGSALKVAPFVAPERAHELDHFVAAYADFLLDSEDGFVNFAGAGSAQPTSAEQRSVTAWARLVADETQAGRSDAENGLVFGWHREGGLAGFCDDLAVYASGVAVATSCRGAQPQETGRGWLDSDQLAQLYQWADRFAGFAYAPQSDATADAMTIALRFAGMGARAASQSDQQAIEAFAQALYTQIAAAAR